MSIKFKCPQCQKALSVSDAMAGKKGTCPGCKKVLIVPAASKGSPTNGLAGNGAPQKAARTLADIEAEAAAIFTDKPAENLTEAEIKTIDFSCPMCDEPVQLPVDLAGKNAPCPSCRRIIKVPLLKTRAKIDWKKPSAGLPSLARQDLPAVEGVWDNREVSRVSQEALEEAGALPELREPATVAQRVQQVLIGGAVLAFLVAGAAFVTHRARQEKEVHSVDVAVQCLNDEAARQQLGPVGLAELRRALGLYFLRTNQENCATKAHEHFDAAFEALRSSQGTERDLALVELALARVELGGSGEAVDEGRRLDWKKSKYVQTVQKMVGVTLSAINVRELRLEALRSVLGRVIAAGEPDCALVLANRTFGAAAGSNTDRLLDMEAKGVAGVELLVARDNARAAKVADLLQQEYGRRDRPPLASSAVALVLALGRPGLKVGKFGTDEENERAGTAEGLARQGDLNQARKIVEKADHPPLKLWAQLNVAAAALDANPSDHADLMRAFELEAAIKNPPASPWLRWRLLQLGLRAGMPEERLRTLAENLPDTALRARAQLAILELHLAHSPSAEPDEIVNGVPEQSVARALAHEALARHNVRVDKSMAQKALNWPQPASAFGSLGVALGMQGE